jgi:hypothetical protein
MAEEELGRVVCADPRLAGYNMAADRKSRTTNAVRRIAIISLVVGKAAYTTMRASP